MAPINKKLRALCIKGVLNPFDYFKLKKDSLTKIRKNYKSLAPFELDKIDDFECKLLFRFTKRQIRRLTVALKIPKICVTITGIRFNAVEGLCILLRRLCYPNRLSDLVKLFKRDSTALSRIANWMTRFLASQHGHLLESLDQPWMQTENLEQFSNVISNAGCAYSSIIGFIDGTARPICRPSKDQHLQYSGYKKTHVLKYQSVVIPNGIIVRLDGPFNGRRHDSAILHLSKLLNECRRKLVVSDQKWYSFYGDPGYANQKFIKVGFKNRSSLNESQKQFNKDMSALRVHVEYGFGKIIQLFAFLDFKKNQKLLLQPLKYQYIVAAILSNCHTCMNGSQVGDYFLCSPPTVENYLCY